MTEPRTRRQRKLPSESQEKKDLHSGGLAFLSLGALGVVFGDIGTSPLYAFQQCFKDLHTGYADASSVLGILSLIFWSLILMVCVKYATFIIRADHDGEGGTLAMLALIHAENPRRNTLSPSALMLLVFIGSALLYGDGVITPAISVLSAVEGLKIAAPGAEKFVVPIALALLIALFLFQSRGTGTVGFFFGHVMAVWFLVIAALGVAGIVHAPRVLQAFNPAMGAQFLGTHGRTGIVVLGAVVLCFTGAEALFADLSHFGRLPIVVGWYALVLAALIINYFGQGALLLLHPTQIQTPFFTLVPHMLLWPIVGLATLATVIASQALISSTFTLTQQAIHMGYLPRLKIIQTSKDEQGQVYIASVNYGLMIACAAVVLAFRSSENLGGAYGLAVMGTMVVTSLTFYVVLRRIWKWPRWGATLLVGFFLLMDVSFLIGNIVKIFSGAWVPLVFAVLVFTIFWTWTDCSSRYRRALNSWSMPLDLFCRQLRSRVQQEDSTGVLLSTHKKHVPLVGRNAWLRDQLQHEQILLVTIIEKNVPYVSDEEMCQMEDLGHDLWAVEASLGFMQHPDITRVIEHLSSRYPKLDWDKLVCYLPEATFISRGSWWHQLLQRFYIFLRRNSLSAAEYFRVPAREIVHIGVRLEL